MTDAEINQAIGEHLGWSWCEKCNRWHSPSNDQYSELPNYVGDLNAMHSAVMAQGPMFRLRFEHAIQDAAKNLGLLVCELPVDVHAKTFLTVEP